MHEYIYGGNYHKAKLINMFIFGSKCCSTVDQLLFNFRIIHDFNMLFNSCLTFSPNSTCCSTLDQLSLW